MSRVLLPFPAQRAMAEALAPTLGARVGDLDWRRFPDGESLVTVDPQLQGADVAFIVSLNRPDEIALALRFAAETARDLGARSIGLIAPYLAYLRQDARFHPGEAVSAPLFARFLESSFEWVVTIDPHLHRTAALGELFEIPATNVSAAPAIIDWLRSNVPDAMLIGPDAESAQWVARIAESAGCPWQVLEKVRRGDHDVDVSLPDVAGMRDRTPVLVDDIVSTGRTLVAALAQLRQLALPPAVCIATHAVFAEGALEQLLAAGASRVVSTDTIPHSTNAIAVAPLLSTAANEGFDSWADNIAATPAASDRWFVDEDPTP